MLDVHLKLKDRRGSCRYHTGCGFYINSALVFAAITATIWVYLLLALTGILTFPCGPGGTQLCSTINGAIPCLQYARLAEGTTALWQFLVRPCDTQQLEPPHRQTRCCAS